VLTLDLTGLPPTPREVEDFVYDNRPDAYERLIDRLLASPRFGEHMASDWLDVARYADTHGYQMDRYRAMWPYRDWVIKSVQRKPPLRSVHHLANWPAICCPRRPKSSGWRRRSTACTCKTRKAASSRKKFRVSYVVDRVYYLRHSVPGPHLRVLALSRP